MRSLLILTAAVLAQPANAAPDVAAAVADFLRGSGRQTDVSLDPRLRLQKCDSPPAVDWAPGNRALAVTCQSPAWRVFVPATARAAAPDAGSIMAVRLRSNLTRGSVVAASDLELAAIGTSGPDMIREIDMAAGQRLARSLTAGTPLRLSMLERAPTVRRRDRVTIVSEAAGFQVSADGQALEDGAPGSRVLVRNLSSGERLRGLVGADGNILIGR